MTNRIQFHKIFPINIKRAHYDTNSVDRDKTIKTCDVQDTWKPILTINYTENTPFVKLGFTGVYIILFYYTVMILIRLGVTGRMPSPDSSDTSVIDEHQCQLLIFLRFLGNIFPLGTILTHCKLLCFH